MPFTIFHYPFGYWFSKVDEKLVLPALLVGSVIPDIEVPFLYLFFTGIVPDHFILHSLIGALSIGLVIAIAVTKFVYPTMINWIFKVDKVRLNEACKVTPWMVFSCAIGIVGHIAVDLLHHWYNPVLWPWVDPYLVVGPVVSFFAAILATDILTGYMVANGLTHIVMLVVLVLIIAVNKENRWEKLWLGS
jgi:hypothetical protein